MARNAGALIAIGVLAAGAAYFATRDAYASTPPVPTVQTVVQTGTGAGGYEWRVVTWPPPSVPTDSILAYAAGGSGYAAQVFHEGRWRYVPPPYINASDATELAQIYLQRVRDGEDILVDLETS